MHSLPNVFYHFISLMSDKSWCEWQVTSCTMCAHPSSQVILNHTMVPATCRGFLHRACGADRHPALCCGSHCLLMPAPPDPVSRARRLPPPPACHYDAPSSSLQSFVADETRNLTLQLTLQLQRNISNPSQLPRCSNPSPRCSKQLSRCSNQPDSLPVDAQWARFGLTRMSVMAVVA